MAKRSQKTSGGNNGSKSDSIPTGAVEVDAVQTDAVQTDAVQTDAVQTDTVETIEADVVAAAAAQRMEDWSAALYHLSATAEILVKLDTGVISDRIVKQLRNVNLRVRKLAGLDVSRGENRTKRLDTLKKKLTKLKTAASKLDVNLDTL